jgi:putative aminopeptidase FrvX
MKEAIYAMLAELTALDGVSGQETTVVRRLAEFLRPAADEVTVDPMGNLYAIRRGAGPGPTLAVFAHSDEIGMIVKAVGADGFIRFHTIGGTPAPVLPARVVCIGGRHLGVIGIKSGHYQTADDASRVKPAAESYIDVGARSAAEVDAIGIRVGDPIVFVAPLTRLTHNPDLVSGKAVDNRIACALLVRLFLDHIAVPAGTLVGVVVVQEEVGLRGARVAAHRLQPDLAIVVDTMPAAGTPDMHRDTDLNTVMSGGPAFQIMSRGYLMLPGVKNFLVQIAEAEGIPYQISALHTSDTDAAAIQLAGRGIPTGVIALPRRYSHSPVEMLDLNDAANALRLLKAIVDQMGRLPALGLVD